MQGDLFYFFFSETFFGARLRRAGFLGASSAASGSTTAGASSAGAASTAGSSTIGAATSASSTTGAASGVPRSLARRANTLALFALRPINYP
jgi:guanyl-specific ribonuclease Sa